MSRKTILVIDDEIGIRNSLQGVLSDENFGVELAESGTQGLQKLTQIQPDAILLDIWMPELDGMECLKRLRAQYPEIPVIMMSGHGTIETAVKATKLGAFDFVEKPLSVERVLVSLRNALEAKDLFIQNRALKAQQTRTHQLIGESAAIRALKQLIQKVAPTTGSVLITGENGTGKEVVAHQIHALSQRYSKAMIEVNCAAIPEEMIESELFGHEKGAFTGAAQLRRGKFDLADGGTIFLDEIGDMSLKTQAKILRILQERTFERVGGSERLTVDVRLIAATNKDLKLEIKEQRFREDLFYRLNVVPIHLPPLRERKEDIALLANHFLGEFSTTHSKPPRQISTQARQLLETYEWPGNVRELKNLIERLVILSDATNRSEQIMPAELFEHLGGEAISLETHPPETLRASGKSLRAAREDFERDYIVRTLQEQGGNISKTAAILGVERSHLHRKIKTFGIES